MFEMTIAHFNHLNAEIKKELLFTCCGSNQWVSKMIALTPFEDLVHVLENAEEAWDKCDEQALLEAFSHHPKIGDLQNIDIKFKETSQFTNEEQGAIKSANSETLDDLSTLNLSYQKKFGFIFIASASGCSGDDLLNVLKIRIENDRQSELKIAAAEQIKITKLRLQKLFI